MGLFDMFGAGGGGLDIQPQAQQVAVGGPVAGTVTFTGGTRAQKITSITVKLVVDTKSTQMTPQGPQQRSETRDVCPPATLTGAYQTQPRQAASFPFNFTLPAGMPSSTAGQITYRLHATADIDGEIDPGKSVELQVTGGAPMVQQGMPGQVAALAGQMPGQMGAMAGQIGAVAGQVGMLAGQMGAMPGQMPQQPMMSTPQPPQMGSVVMAQWQDGNWYPGKIVAVQNGMFGVDWDNPALGQSTWVQPMQVQVSPQMGAMPVAGMPVAGMPVAAAAMPVASMPMGKDPATQKGVAAPMQKDMSTQKKDFSTSKGGDASHKGALAVGAACIAQHANGNWYAGRVAALQNGMIGVDWDDPQLGESSWVGAHQIKPR